MAELSFDDLIPSQGGQDYGQAISSIESSGNYRAIGPVTKSGDRALGKYQVMGANIGPWSREILGREVTPQEFISNNEIQDAIFNGKFGQYAEKYGPEGAAKAWFAGEKGMNNPNAKDVLGTTVASYGAKFNKALGQKPSTDVSARAKAPVDLSFDDLIPAEPAVKPQEGATFDDRFPADGSFAPTKKEVGLTDVITDIPKEIGNAAGEALTNIKGIANRGGQGPIEGLVTTGKAVLGVPQLIMSPVTGAARSVLGHGMESAQHAVGSIIAPEIAAKEDRRKNYETAKGDVDTAMTAVRPAGVPIKVSGPSTTTRASPRPQASGEAAADQSARVDAFRRTRDAATRRAEEHEFQANSTNEDLFLTPEERAFHKDAAASDRMTAASIDRHIEELLRSPRTGGPPPQSETTIATAPKPAYEWQHPPTAPAKTTVPTIQELKTAARADYNSPEVKGLVVTPDTIRNYGSTARADLNRQGFDENVAPKTFGILSKLDTIPAGASVTGDNFNSLRKMLGKAAGSIEPAEKAAASMAIEHLDNFIPAIPAGEVIAGDVGAAASKLETARGNYSAAKQSEKIDQKLVAAETRAAAANSGMNVANTIRQRMADVVLNPKQARGLRPEEIETAKAISEGTRTQNLIRGASNILGGGGGLGTVAAATAGGLATGGPGALAPVAGFALKALSNKLTIRQAEKLSEMIRSRAPLASSAAKYNQAAANLQASRTPQAIAGALLAARNFATNLRGAGFNVSPAELLSGMQTTRAEEQQEQIPRPDAE
jgi:hypothetical protein